MIGDLLVPALLIFIFGGDEALLLIEQGATFFATFDTELDVSRNRRRTGAISGGAHGEHRERVDGLLPRAKKAYPRGGSPNLFVRAEDEAAAKSYATR